MGLRRPVIVATRPDGGVRILTPVASVMAAMCNGGGLVAANGRTREIEKWVNGGLDGDLATRWIDALSFGGQTTATALDLIRLKDVPRDFHAVEVWDWQPMDRFFRDAWRRSRNGGPIWIDMEKAREDMARRIVRARERRAAENEVARMTGGPAVAPNDFVDLSVADTPEHLKSLWPADLT